MLGNRFLGFRCLLALGSVAATLATAPALAIDLEAFEFADANGTVLASALNSVNPGNNWTTSEVLSNPAFSPSEVNGGSYQLAKETQGLATAHLQIANATSGSVYLVARMAGWAFRQSDPADPAEEVRFAFLNDDTGISGSTITAEAVIRRNAAGTIELAGRALGIGGTTIADTAPLATDQTTPFTLVLEANLDTDTYKVFYKDGASPSQFLGLGALAPTRDANSVRFAANNFFGDGNFFPVVIEEQVQVDRIAVSTTNPLSDFLTATVNRTTGALTLVNNTGVALSGLLSYSIESSAGSLNPGGWKTVAGNYDVNGDKSVDLDGVWSVQTASASTLTEGVLDAGGGALAAGQSVVLSQPSGVWLQSPFEDVSLKLNFVGGVTRSADVSFIGNSGSRFAVGDLNFDGQVTAADWTTLITNAETSLAGLTPAQAYRRGDLDGDSVNSIFDVGVFQSAYDAANGPGAFAALAASVPEPPGVLLALLVIAGCLMRRGKGLAGWACLGLLLATPSAGRAAILDDFPFTDANGARLGEVENVANPAHVWLEETALMTESFVNGGVLRVQKANDDFARNILDINNVTSGKAWLVAEIAGWSFSSLVGPGEFDSAQLEEFRLNFLDNDTGLTNASSVVTAEARIVRNASGGIELAGSALGGGTPIAATPLSLNQSQPFQLVLELDNDANTYTLYTKNGAGPYASAGTGNISSTRNGNSVRMGFNNNFGGTGEFFDLDRLYVTTDSPIVGVVEPLTLRVNTTTGAVSIVNDSTMPYTFDSYRIESASGSLRAGDAFWSSLSDRGIDAVDGPDGEGTLGDGVGETWDEAGGSGPGVLAESFLLGATTLAPMAPPLSLGNPVTPGGSPLIEFQFRRADTGAVVNGLVEFVTGGLQGDYNGDGAVDAADYTVWRDTLGLSVPNGTGADGDSNGTITANDLAVWRNSFGAGGLAAAAAGSPVPEPAAALLLFAAASLALGRRRIA